MRGCRGRASGTLAGQLKKNKSPRSIFQEFYLGQYLVVLPPMCKIDIFVIQHDTTVPVLAFVLTSTRTCTDVDSCSLEESFFAV